MLLIGSRATHVHFSAFRKPKDWDVIATPDEADSLLKKLPKTRPAHRPNKICFLHRGTLLEVEIAYPGSTAARLLAETSGAKSYIPDAGWADVATPEALLLIKQSHVPFAIHWQKTVRDIHFLRRRIGDVSSRLEPLLEARLEETAGFMLPSQRRIPRGTRDACGLRGAASLHGRVHEAVKLGAQPARRETTAFADLSREGRIVLLAEETMTLAVERMLIAGTHVGSRANEAWYVEAAYEQMVTSGLPAELRLTAVIYMDRVLSRIPDGFSSAAIAKIASSNDVLPAGTRDSLRHDDDDLLVRYRLG